jgi:hypothetical protein
MIMFEKLRTRRQIVESVGALGLLGTAAALHTARPAHAAAVAKADATVGTWLATVTIEVPHAPAPYGALLTLNAGGTMISSNARERLTMAGAQYGSWVTNADGTVSILGIGFLFDAKGNPIGIHESHVSFALGADGNTAGGRTTVYTRNFTGKVLATAHASYTATRVVVK